MALVDSLSRSDAGMTEKARMVVATDVGIVCDALSDLDLAIVFSFVLRPTLTPKALH